MHRIKKDIAPYLGSELENYTKEILLLKKLRSHDEYTYLHSLNVTQISIGLGVRLGFSPKELKDLAWAALLHDIGKISIPLNLLNKPSSFSSVELKTMKSHPWAALLELVDETEVTLGDVLNFVPAFEHHQRYDLLGYPDVGQKIRLHPFSRIIAIADTFDAMTSDRIYHRRILPDIALKIMSQGFGSIFDPIALHAFISTMGAYPVTSVVRLSDQTLAVVVAYKDNSEMDRPIVIRVNDSDKTPLNLMLAENKHLKIVKSEFPEDHGLRVSDFLKANL